MQKNKNSTEFKIFSSLHKKGVKINKSYSIDNLKDHHHPFYYYTSCTIHALLLLNLVEWKKERLVSDTFNFAALEGIQQFFVVSSFVQT